jgi:hypothetical protein
VALHKRSVPIVTAAGGTFSATVRGVTILRRIDLELGTLSTPDIDITDEDSGVVVLSVNGVNADTQYFPTILGTDDAGADVTGAALPFPVMGRLQIEVTGGGNVTSGRLLILYET